MWLSFSTTEGVTGAPDVTLSQAEKTLNIRVVTDVTLRSGIGRQAAHVVGASIGAPNVDPRCRARSFGLLET
jgi:hypothetical protein